VMESKIYLGNAQTKIDANVFARKNFCVDWTPKKKFDILFFTN